MLKILHIVRNKYFIASTAFVVWMLFFDRNDLPSQIHYQQQLSHLKQEKEFYLQETAQVEQDLKDLNSSIPEQLQKFARERYLMKKDNEDVFVILEEEIVEKE